MPTVSKLTKAKVALVIDQPFFATVLMKLKLIERTDLPTKTMATDGLNIYYDPKFVEDHAVDELKFVLCHEVLHVAYEHMARRGGRHAEMWNHACDYVINDVLSKCEKVGRMPAGGLLNPQLVANGTTSEGVYKLLPEPEEGDDGGGGDIGGRYRGLGEGQPLDDHLDPPDMTEAEKEERSGKVQEIMAEAAQAAKMVGKLPAHLKELIDDMLSADHDWEDKLREYMSAPAKIERTFKRPNRRYIWSGLYLPSRGGNRLRQVVIAKDESGSCSNDDQKWFNGTTKKVREDTHPLNTEVLSFTTKITHHEHLDEYDDWIDTTRHGSGGTCIAPVFDRIMEEGWTPDCLIILTDLYIDDFPDIPPDYPVLWVTTSNYTDAPFGEVVKMHNDR